MISTQMLQSTIEGMKAIAKADFCIFDIGGRALASSCGVNADYAEVIPAFVVSSSEQHLVQASPLFLDSCWKTGYYKSRREQYTVCFSGKGLDAWS